MVENDQDKFIVTEAFKKVNDWACQFSLFPAEAAKYQWVFDKLVTTPAKGDYVYSKDYFSYVEEEVTNYKLTRDFEGMQAFITMESFTPAYGEKKVSAKLGVIIDREKYEVSFSGKKAGGQQETGRTENLKEAKDWSENLNALSGELHTI